MSKGRLLLPIFVLLAALGLAACGGGESDEDKIASAIETAATSEDPAACKETETQEFMEVNSGGEGQEAVERCEEDNENGESNAESVEVSEVEVEGSEASAVAAITGGSLDGQTVALNLVEEEGDWKLSEFEEFVKFDGEKLIASFESTLEGNEEIAPEVSECLIESLEESSESELEELFLSGSEGIEAFAQECVE